MVFNIAAQQFRDGRWHFGGIPRPPIEDGDFSRTALAIRALKTYAPPGRAAEMTERVKRAAGWLTSARPVTSEDRAFRLLGLAWAGDSGRTLQRAAAAIVADQRSDGGWAQRDELQSDAYATGLSVYALLESGAAKRTDASIQRSTAYLLSSQRADGSWYVRSRSPKFQPYFDGGFPYEHDQWISSMATGWATAAIANSLDGTATTASP
jgi:squalene cyclase